MIKVILKRYKWVIIAITISALLFAWVIIAYISKFYGDLSNDQTVFGLFGDYVGGTLGSIFAFLSFMALLITIHLQHQDLVETRREAKEQRELADDQRKTLQLQRFETTFFNMLSQVSVILNMYKPREEAGVLSFQDAMKNVVLEKYNDQTRIDDIFRSYEIKYLFGNFVHHISNILEFTEKSLTAEERSFYYSIVNGLLPSRHKAFLEMCSRSSDFIDQKKFLEILGKYNIKTEVF